MLCIALLSYCSCYTTLPVSNVDSVIVYTVTIGMHVHTVSQKTSHVWFAITLTHVNAFWYFWQKCYTDKVSNQKALYCATSNNVCFCTTWQNGETRKSHFFTQMLYQCFARIQPVVPWFLQFFWLTSHTHAAVWLPKSCNQCVQLGAVGRSMVQEKGSRERSSMQLDCVACTMHVHQCAVFLKEKNVICDVFDSV